MWFVGEQLPKQLADLDIINPISTHVVIQQGKAEESLLTNSLALFPPPPGAVAASVPDILGRVGGLERDQKRQYARKRRASN